MEQKYNIELIEEYEDINFYSIHLEGEELSEFENFFEKFPEGCSYDEEIEVVIFMVGQNLRTRSFGTLFPSGRPLWRWCWSYPNRYW